MKTLVLKRNPKPISVASEDKDIWAGEMASHLKVFAALSVDQGLVLSTYMRWLKATVASSPEYLMPYSHLQRQYLQAHGVHTVKLAHTHNKKN